MAYENAVLRRAEERLARAREDRARERWLLRKRLYEQRPELQKLDGALRGTMAELAELAVGGETPDVEGKVADIRRRNEALRARRKELLASLGYAEDALDDLPACPDCRDTGWQGAKMCHCLHDLCAEEQIKELSNLLQLGKQNFDSARLTVYGEEIWESTGTSPRKNMEVILQICKDYAEQFGAYPLKNLFFSGDTGLGKTFLSACIARRVSEKGCSVVYDTAGSVFSAFETRKFSKDEGDARQARDGTRRYLLCDLLILDDLGSELTTPFVQTALYELVNSRLASDRRTVISSNLTMADVRARYSPQIASRLAGEYRVLPFFGDDIRLKNRT